MTVVLDSRPMPIPVRRADAACGAEIVFDLAAPIDDATFGRIRARLPQRRLMHRTTVIGSEPF